MDPTAYDPDDLRALAGAATESDDETPASPSADERFRATHRRALVRTVRGLPASAEQRPYLATPPSSARAEALAADWLDFLVRRAGRRGAVDALDYYRRLGWLSASSERWLRARVEGTTDDGGGDGVDADAHRLSLLYVARLAAVATEG